MDQEQRDALIERAIDGESLGLLDSVRLGRAVRQYTREADKAMLADAEAREADLDYEAGE